jgi:RecA/RadA recombinase
MSSSIMDKLKKNSKIKTTDVLSESKFFNEKDMTPTDVPMVNVALSGSIDGGLSSGLLVLAGPSKHFKTSFALLMAGAYLRKHPDAVMLFYDSEFGSPQSYFTQFGIDTSRVLHTPIANVEELKFDIMGQLEGMDRDDKVIIVIDSIGNMASKKEMEDALNEKSVADMSRAKALKGLFRMTTPYLSMKNIPLIAVNHTYMEIGCFLKLLLVVGLVSTIQQIIFGFLVVNKIKLVLRLKVITLLLMSRNHALLKKSQRFLSLFLGRVVFNVGLVCLKLLLLVTMLLNRLMVGINWLTGKLVNSLDKNIEKRILLQKNSGNQS